MNKKSIITKNTKLNLSNLKLTRIIKVPLIKTYDKYVSTSQDNKKNQEVKVYNHWWFTEYANDIYENLREKEKHRLKFYSQSPQINYRYNLIQLMIAIADNEELSRTTVHLGVYLLDLFMDNHKIFVERLKLVALVCLLLASKLEEKESKILKIAELNEMISNQYQQIDYASLEIMILSFFDWNIILPTTAHFVDYFVSAVVSDHDYSVFLKSENANEFRNKHEMFISATNLVFEFLNLILSDLEMLAFLPSKLAASCLACGRKALNITEPLWTDYLEELTKYKLIDLEDIIKMLLHLKQKSLETKKKSNDSGYLTESDH